MKMNDLGYFFYCHWHLKCKNASNTVLIPLEGSQVSGAMCLGSNLDLEADRWINWSGYNRPRVQASLSLQYSLSAQVLKYYVQ